MHKSIKIVIFTCLLITLISIKTMAQNIETATLGGGCFWCTEAIYNELKGVIDVKPGYSGGNIKRPSYKEVCTGNTGHAEVIQIEYDTNVVSFFDILQIFFMTHDPTTLNRQGADVGTQYRSVIFYHNEEQKKAAEKVIRLFEQEKVYDSPIVTEVSEFKEFYVAEDYHDNYFEQNKEQSYCKFVIAPKVDKFKKIFKEKLK